ncbi:MAG: hypothetical protein VX126_03705 [Planctomycetota bacterium]|nr:hypothetical protein [Planctomycetota bacterium]MEC8251367.1 hypothetical protein [Planctomycetota bacterium]
MIGYVVRGSIRLTRAVLPGKLLARIRTLARRVLPGSVQQYLLRQERRTFSGVQKDDLHFLRDKLIERQDLMFQKLEQRIERLAQKIDELNREEE